MEKEYKKALNELQFVKGQQTKIFKLNIQQLEEFING